jgi:hypothetical protein
LKYKLQLLVVGEYTRINLFYHSLNLQKRIHRPDDPGRTSDICFLRNMKI